MKSLKEQVADLEISAPKDFDPEEDDIFGQPPGDDSSDDEIVDGKNRREHYENVSKSQLRQPEPLQLGTQYSGAAVSRNALQDGVDVLEADSDDPFARREESISVDGYTGSEEGQSDFDVDGTQEDEEIVSDDAFGSGDKEKFKDLKFLGSKGRTGRAGKENERGDNEDDEEQDGDSELNDEDQDYDVHPAFGAGEDVDMEAAGPDIVDSSVSSEGPEDDEDSDSPTSPESRSRQLEPSSDREKLRALLSNDAAAVTSSLAAAANADVSKGQAVKQQYQAFDRLLDARIKLQKGLTAANDIGSVSDLDDEAAVVVKKAEEAALKLFSTIESLRHRLEEVQQSNPKKRKRGPPVTSSTPSSDLWNRVHSLEGLSFSHRRRVLDKWAAKTRAANLSTAPPSQLLDRYHTIDQSSITAILDGHLTADAGKHLASAIASDGGDRGAGSLPIYNDTSFYQSLLRDLISSRSMLNPAASSVMSSEPLPTKLHQSGSKTKKVDTKASKGRKVRYTVHEKLQNFCAEEDRSTWSESARREFFASLFGGQGMLREDVDGMEERDDDVTTHGGKEEEALRLFRN